MNTYSVWHATARHDGNQTFDDFAAAEAEFDHQVSRREILDTAPAQLMQMISYKAEDAGAWIMEAPTRKLKPSQTCPSCGRQEKKTLSQRTHSCGCGHVEDRDLAAARVVLNWARLPNWLGNRASGEGRRWLPLRTAKPQPLHSHRWR